MKTMLKQTLATFFLSAVLAGCSSTPDIHEDFTAREGDSYAKTTMRLMGTNKFVDSASGDEGTRKVVGSGAMKVLQLASLDFVGLAQNSLSDYLIEDEPIAKFSQLLVKLDDVSEAELSNPEALIIQANTKISDFIASNEDKVGVASIKKQGLNIFYTFDNTAGICKNLMPFKSCSMNFTQPKVVKYIKSTKQAYIRYVNVGHVILSHLLGSYESDDLSLYVTPRVTFYGSGNSYQTVTKIPVVINKGRVHKFIKGDEFTGGSSVGDLIYYFQKKNGNTGTAEQYKINVADYTYTKIN